MLLINDTNLLCIELCLTLSLQLLGCRRPPREFPLLLVAAKPITRECSELADFKYSNFPHSSTWSFEYIFEYVSSSKICSSKWPMLKQNPLINGWDMRYWRTNHAGAYIFEYIFEYLNDQVDELTPWTWFKVAVTPPRRPTKKVSKIQDSGAAAPRRTRTNERLNHPNHSFSRQVIRILGYSDHSLHSLPTTLVKEILHLLSSFCQSPKEVQNSQTSTVA